MLDNPRAYLDFEPPKSGSPIFLYARGALQNSLLIGTFSDLYFSESNTVSCLKLRVAFVALSKESNCGAPHPLLAVQIALYLAWYFPLLRDFCSFLNYRSYTFTGICLSLKDRAVGDLDEKGKGRVSHVFDYLNKESIVRVYLIEKMTQ